jgi:GTPase involved in cell partitioning and DNA repair
MVWCWGNGACCSALSVFPHPRVCVCAAVQVHWKGSGGMRGSGKSRTGASAPDVIVDVPPGTVVRTADGVLAGQLTHAGEVRHGPCLLDIVGTLVCNCGGKGEWGGKSRAEGVGRVKGGPRAPGSGGTDEAPHVYLA